MENTGLSRYTPNRLPQLLWHLLLVILVCTLAACPGANHSNIEPLHRPFAVNPFNKQQRVLGIFEAELGLNLVGLYITNTSGSVETNVVVNLDVPVGTGIRVTRGSVRVPQIEPAVSTIVFFEADFTGVATDKYDLKVTTSSDQSPAKDFEMRIFTAVTKLNPSDQDFSGHPTFATSFPEGTLTVDIESFHGGPNWRSMFAPTRETMSLVYKEPFEGKMGPVPYKDWLWKAAGLVGKGLVAFSSGYYLAEGIDEGDVAKTSAAAGGALMTVAEVATFSDEEDPIFRGQKSTTPGAGEKTYKEIVTLDATYPEEPLCGETFKANTSWVYTRYTRDGSGAEKTYEYKIADEIKVNQHAGGAHTLKTDKDSYQAGELATISATLKSPSGTAWTGDQAYLSVVLQASSAHNVALVLTDDGQGGDATPNDGTYTVTTKLSSDWPTGKWSLAIFGQKNLFSFNEYGGLCVITIGAGGPNAVWERTITVN